LRHAFRLASGVVLVVAGCIDLTPPRDRDAGTGGGGPEADGGVDAAGGAGGDAAVVVDEASAAGGWEARADGGDAPADAPGNATEGGADVLPSTLGMGLVAYWTMDDGSGNKFLDETTNRNDLIIEGLPDPVTTGLPALSFANPSAFDFHFPDDGAW